PARPLERDAVAADAEASEHVPARPVANARIEGVWVVRLLAHEAVRTGDPQVFAIDRDRLKVELVIAQRDLGDEPGHLDLVDQPVAVAARLEALDGAA